MKNIIFLLLTTFSLEVLGIENASSCDESGVGHEKIEIVWDDFTTKADPKNKNRFLPKVLYCDKPRSSGECTDGSVWYSYSQFVKYKANHSSVICSYRKVNVTNGAANQKIVIYVDANKANQR